MRQSGVGETDVGALAVEPRHGGGDEDARGQHATETRVHQPEHLARLAGRCRAVSWKAAFTSMVMSAASTPCPMTSATRSTAQSRRQMRSYRSPPGARTASRGS